MTGGLLGLVPAAGLAVLRVINEHNLGWEEVPGNTVFGIIYSLPYVLALITSRLPQAAAQAPLLLSITLLSLLASFSAFSGVSVVLLPATIVLGIATARAYRASQIGLIWHIAYAIGGILATSFFVGSFLALFLHEDGRAYRSGTGAGWVSDITTPIEALVALGLAACGLLVLASIARYGGRRTADGP